MLKVVFDNPNAARRMTIIRCDRQSVDNICEWYASHHAGDKYDVWIDGQKRVLDDYGMVVGIE